MHSAVSYVSYSFFSSTFSDFVALVRADLAKIRVFFEGGRFRLSRLYFGAAIRHFADVDIFGSYLPPKVLASALRSCDCYGINGYCGSSLDRPPFARLFEAFDLNTLSNNFIGRFFTASVAMRNANTLRDCRSAATGRLAAWYSPPRFVAETNFAEFDPPHENLFGMLDLAGWRNSLSRERSPIGSSSILWVKKPRVRATAQAGWPVLAGGSRWRRR